jgi:hypothetical protein
MSRKTYKQAWAETTASRPRLDHHGAGRRRHLANGGPATTHVATGCAFACR